MVPLEDQYMPSTGAQGSSHIEGIVPAIGCHGYQNEPLGLEMLFIDTY